jgi:hypothetical protein
LMAQNAGKISITMSVQIHKDLITDSDVSALIDYCENEPGLPRDERPDVTNLDLQIDQGHWYQDLLVKICDSIAEEGWSVGRIAFWKSKISWSLHTDTGDGSNESVTGKNIVIPLEWEDGNGTVVFTNRWSGKRVVFSKTIVSNFRVFLPKKDGTFAEVDDIRKLNSVENLDITAEELEILKQKRTAKSEHSNKRISDYSVLSEYKDNQLFDPAIHKEYLQHVDIKDLHGLTVDKILEWKKNEIYSWDRQQVHCSTHQHSMKSMITIWLNKN